MSLDADEDHASDLIDAQVDWLLAQQIIAPSAKPDTLYGTFREGPRFAEAMEPESVPPGAVAGGRYILFGVRVRKGWQISHNMDGFEGPSCPRCGHQQFDDGVAGGLIFDWYESRAEPTVTCTNCGHIDLIGNWPHEYFGYCNYASLSFVNSPPLSIAFRDELLVRIGNRPRAVHVRL
ncbi:hypothetical protein QM583_08635 [Gordonia alkanivorans]|uniref:hypothetical protein n=1 Tax=Gordonia TaxID=2053 RepID=UPI0024B68185|nr:MULTISPECIES: hypothetical protein [Gordonia]MDJ0027157.1 hypothetical protein [Gordonia alkanivorans]WJG11419.1 hypothetical protein PWF70_12245 [Gordonia sp. Swx-4]